MSQSDSDEQAGVGKITQLGSKSEEDLTEFDVLTYLVRQAWVLRERNKLVSTMTNLNPQPPIKESLEPRSWVLHSAMNKLKPPPLPLRSSSNKSNTAPNMQLQNL